jgi:hypothetical protein
MSSHCAFDAAAAAVASPRWLHVAESPHERLDRFFPTALLMQTAALDATEPPSDARELHEALVPHYASAPERLRYLEYPSEHHMLSKRAWPRLGEGARLVRTLPERLELIRQP